MDVKRYPVPTPGTLPTGASARVTVPGSKSITNRALLLAALSQGTSTLHGCLSSADAQVFLECLCTLGFAVTRDGDDITVTGCGGRIPRDAGEIYVGSAGTAARFLTAMLAFSRGEYTVCSSPQMQRRPMAPLIAALRAAGAEVECLGEEGHFPLRIRGAAPEQIPDALTVNIDESSQFLSALLIAAGTLPRPLQIRVTGSHGLAYVEMTAAMMAQFGVTPAFREGTYHLPGADGYLSREYIVEPDLSAAAYFYAMAALTGAQVTVERVSAQMLQGDAAFLDVLEQMGCRVLRGAEVTVIGSADGRLRGGFTVDMSAFSDQALTLAAIAPYADAPIRIIGIGHIRLQECNRIQAIVKNLAALGVPVTETADGVQISPAVPRPCEIETFEDHRVAMAFALTGLRTPGVVIRNPDCCKKTFAEYFTVLENTLSQLSE